MSADHLAVEAIVTRVLIGFEQGRGRSDEETDVLVGEFVDAMKGLPLAGIHAAADRFRSGQTLEPWNRRFRPSPAEFAAEVRKGLISTRTQLLHVRRILDAEVYDPASDGQREQVAEVARELARELARSAAERRIVEVAVAAAGPGPAEIARRRELHADLESRRIRRELLDLHRNPTMTSPTQSDAPRSGETA